MTGLMNAVYQRLLPLPLALHRAWPQAAQPLPGLSFSLLDYEAGEEGQGQVKIRLSLSAALPEEADALGWAMRPRGRCCPWACAWPPPGMRRRRTPACS